jgi:hypothetical protein
MFLVLNAVEAGVRFHARVLPAGLYGPCYVCSGLGGWWLRGQRQHFLHSQLSGFSTSMSIEVRATLVSTDPVLVHGPVRVFLFGLGQSSLGVHVCLSSLRFEYYHGRRESPRLLWVQETVLPGLMIKGLESHGTLITPAHRAPQAPLHRRVRWSLVVLAEFVYLFHLLLFQKLIGSFGLALPTESPARVLLSGLTSWRSNGG